MCIIEAYSECTCGSVTIYFEGGGSNSFSRDSAEGFNIDLEEVERLQNSYCCNHCVNHYGLDLCACGSGETPENCDEGLDSCGKPMESFGVAVKLKHWT